MKKTLLVLTTFAIFAAPALGITYRKPVTAHEQLSSTGTLTHAALESTLTAVNAATTTLKSVSDAHAATLLQVGVDTETLAGLVGGGDYLTISSATATYGQLAANNAWTAAQQMDTITTTSSTNTLTIGGNGAVGMGTNNINFKAGMFMGADYYWWINNVFPFFKMGGSSSNNEWGGLYLYSTNHPVYGNQYLRISNFQLYASTGITINGPVTATRIIGDVSGCTNFPAASPSYFTVSPSTGIDAGVLADSVKVTTANVQATGTPDGTTFLRGDGSWSTPSGSGDMVQATHGVAIGASTETLRADVTALQQSTGTLQADIATEVSDRGLADVSIGVTTGTLRTDVTAVQSTLTAVGTSTATLRSDITGIGVSTAAIKTILTQVQTDTGTIKAQITSIGASTATLRTDVTALQQSTGTLLSRFTAVGASTATLRTDYTALAQSTGAFTTVGTATATLRTDLTSVKQSTAVTITSNWITLGATQTYVTTLSTRIASGIQTQPFTISSATARVNGGTSATLRLFITDKNTEFNISAATPIWNTGVVAGTAHTGGTMSNVSVLANQSITAVIDGISGAVVDIVLWVRGYR